LNEQIILFLAPELDFVQESENGNRAGLPLMTRWFTDSTPSELSGNVDESIIVFNLRDSTDATGENIRRLMVNPARLNAARLFVESVARSSALVRLVISQTCDPTGRPT
jgi:hypothetical protein